MVWGLGFFVLTWSIWNANNRVVFWQETFAQFACFGITLHGGLVRPYSFPSKHNITRTTLPQDIIKVNVDYSFSSENYQSGIGRLFSDHEDKFFLHFGKQLAAN